MLSIQSISLENEHESVQGIIIIIREYCRSARYGRFVIIIFIEIILQFFVFLSGSCKICAIRLHCKTCSIRFCKWWFLWLGIAVGGSDTCRVDSWLTILSQLSTLMTISVWDSYVIVEWTLKSDERKVEKLFTSLYRPYGNLRSNSTVYFKIQNMPTVWA